MPTLTPKGNIVATRGKGREKRTATPSTYSPAEKEHHPNKHPNGRLHTGPCWTVCPARISFFSVAIPAASAPPSMTPPIANDSTSGRTQTWRQSDEEEPRAK